MRQEFSKAVKLAAFQRCKGFCEECTALLFPTKTEYHHDKEDTFDGEPTLENCKVLCTACHSRITRRRAAVIAKSSRQRANHLGISSKSRNPLPGGRDSTLKRKIGGTVVRRT